MADKPLAGVAVLDFSELAPGPFMTQYLADLGATVTKIERPPHGDSARTLQPGGFRVMNLGKTSRFVDLQDPLQKAAIVELAATAQLLVEGFRPGVMKRLGLDYEALRESNPALVYVSITGYGQAGALASRPGHDINYLATSGITSLAGGSGQPPKDAMGVPMGDFCASLYAVSTALAALMQARATGRGQHLDVSIVDCLMHWMNVRLGHFQHAGIEGLAAQRDDVFNKPAYGIFATRDHAYVAIAALENHFWERLREALQLELGDIDQDTHAKRLLHAAQINAVIAAAVSVLTADDIVERLTLADVPASRVVEPDELLDSTHAIGRDLVGTAGDLRYVRFPVKMQGGVGD
ncbi:MAG: CaiB/BaiF CoA-transferase family protein [Steroidobacteraceae bacterium]